MCYCNLPVERVRGDLERSMIPDDALTRDCCWEQICRVRGWYPKVITDDGWRELCAKRGYLFQRQNPRGF